VEEQKKIVWDTTHLDEVVLVVIHWIWYAVFHHSRSELQSSSTAPQDEDFNSQIEESIEAQCFSSSLPTYVSTKNVSR